MARSKANLQSETLAVSLGTSVSINAVADLSPGEKVNYIYLGLPRDTTKINIKCNVSEYQLLHMYLGDTRITK